MVKWCPTLSRPPRDSPGKNTRVGCRFLLQRTFLTRHWIGISQVSCTGSWVLCHYATWEALEETQKNGVTGQNGQSPHFKYDLQPKTKENGMGRWFETLKGRKAIHMEIKSKYQVNKLLPDLQDKEWTLISKTCWISPAALPLYSLQAYLVIALSWDLALYLNSFRQGRWGVLIRRNTS